MPEYFILEKLPCGWCGQKTDTHQHECKECDGKGFSLEPMEFPIDIPQLIRTVARQNNILTKMLTGYVDRDIAKDLALKLLAESEAQLKTELEQFEENGI